MALQADRQGFLIGAPLDGDEAERILGKIKGDTGSILALMRRSDRAFGPATPAGRAARSSPLGAAAAVPFASIPGGARSVAVPGGRAAAAALRVRDARGRFAAGGGAPEVSAVADAAASIARSVEQQRRDEKADRASGQTRDGRGRFGAGGGDAQGGGHLGGNLGGAIASGAGVAVQGTEQIDPLMAAIGEARNGLSAMRAAVSPIGRAGMALMGRPAESDPNQPVSWLRRMWRELRGMRKDDARNAKDTQKSLDGVGAAVRDSEGGDGGFSIMSMMGGGKKGGLPIGSLLGGLLRRSLPVMVGGTVASLILDQLGSLTKQSESNGDPGAISSGKGDAGGKSYGAYQLSSAKGTLQKFLSVSGYDTHFDGLSPGSPEFDEMWRQISGDTGFNAAQRDFINRTHVLPQFNRLKGAGLDLSGRGPAVLEAVYSTANQFGPNSDVIEAALAGRDVAGMSDAAIVAAIQDYKVANNETLFRSSDAATRAGTLARAERERAALLSLAGGAATPRMPIVPGTPALSTPTAPGAAPSIEGASMQRLNSGGGAPAAAPAAPAAQDVRDRGIAHIVTGGIGTSSPHR